MASNSKHVKKSSKTSARESIVWLTVGLFMCKWGTQWRQGTWRVPTCSKEILVFTCNPQVLEWGPKCKHMEAKHAHKQITSICFLSLSRWSFFSLQCRCCSHPHQPDNPIPRLDCCQYWQFHQHFGSFWGDHTRSQFCCDFWWALAQWFDYQVRRGTPFRSFLTKKTHKAGYLDQLTR